MHSDKDVISDTVTIRVDNNTRCSNDIIHMIHIICREIELIVIIFLLWVGNEVPSLFPVYVNEDNVLKDPIQETKSRLKRILTFTQNKNKVLSGTLYGPFWREPVGGGCSVTRERQTNPGIPHLSRSISVSAARELALTNSPNGGGKSADVVSNFTD